MTAPLCSLGWSSSTGRTRWLARRSTWVGAYESWRLRQGTYVSARGPMLVFALRGTTRASLGPNRQRVSLSEGDALVIEARTPFSFELDRARMLIAELSPEPGPARVGLRRVPADQIPRRVQQWMRQCWQSPSDLLAAGEMADYVRELPGSSVAFCVEHNTARMLSAKEQLEALYTGPVRLRDVARSLKLDPFYLSRAFARTTGITPKSYVQLLRAEHFLRALISRPSGCLTALALDAGAPDYSAFSRWIKQHFGVPPTELVAREAP